MILCFERAAFRCVVYCGLWWRRYTLDKLDLQAFGINQIDAVSDILKVNCLTELETGERVGVTCSGEAVLPVPMAHTGSYASTTLPQSFTFSGTQQQQEHPSIRQLYLDFLILILSFSSAERKPCMDRGTRRLRKCLQQQRLCGECLHDKCINKSSILLHKALINLSA